MSIYSSVLIIGATSGIGAGLARRIHAEGKKVIATGRRQDRLTALAAEFPGLETFCFDFSDVSSLATHFADITTKHPDIDTVIISAAVQSLLFFNEPATSSDTIINEVRTNVTAPMVLCQLLVPFFLESKKPCSIIFVSSGFAYIPAPFFPVYCPTKAAIHSFAIALRSQLFDTNVNVTELFPSYVESELDKDFKDRLIEILGGPEKAIPPMPLDDFLDDAMEGLKATEDGKPKKEVAVGHFSENVSNAWRKTFTPSLAIFGNKG